MWHKQYTTVHGAASRASNWLLTAHEYEQLPIRDTTTASIWLLDNPKDFLTPASHVEVGWPGNWGLELLTPNPGSKSTPKACPIRNPATSPARHTQPQPKHPSHRARSSVEIIITVIIKPRHAKNATPKNAIPKRRAK